ncbi:bacillithiol biosynthesis cysteine-adding enzyme BshC [Dyadobacter aurulentus]|uniref:bacillithiol biosynthesis cysteine-adding enzyme BshC n=1 Tax=Dyadobacter sp. UC 10 TaxID=2605428 RepID=UPI0011F10714|nr:bacillithiol biosynthesis cysteine-adding enzyme BshC [Dyadobacter sp. UC 10]KAA0990727.1 bacillithiol biosynthesis cysteine-adding enzyme BshC [Dyadobacter sp. UC 10]
MDSLQAAEKPFFTTLQTVDLRATGQFPALLLDYLDQKPSLSEFYSAFPTLENANEVITAKRAFDTEKRKTLVNVLNSQYVGLSDLPDFSLLLDNKTFTVTTGHQLNIFSGPLYIIYKIVTTIKLARALKGAYPEYNFVPVYWMATEDHDFEEIASVHLFGQTHKWTGDHKGAVGRLNPKELESILKQLPGKPDLFARAYLESGTLADAVRCYMHELFGQYGLVTIDADHADLKRSFLPVIKEELSNNISGKLVSETTSRLNALGYHTPLNAREINLFYLDENLRERIVKEDITYKVLNTGLSFSETEILNLAENKPELFSPNVILRPLYEEMILPNLAYIGGPSEVPYWMQLKGVFDHFGVPFPMLIPRNFALYITGHQCKKVKKLNISYEDLFLDEVALRKTFIERNTQHILDLDDQKEDFNKIFETILEKAIAVDQTMFGAVKAEQTRLLHSLKQLEKRIVRAEERNHQSEIEQLLALKNKLFPNGIAQERYDNLLSFYTSDPEFISKLFQAFDPLDFSYNVILEE